MHGRLFDLQLPFGADYVVPFPSYFVLLLVGFLFATLIGAIWARRIGQNPDVVVDLGLAMLLAGVAGGRLLHVFADGHFWDYVHLCTDPSQVTWNVTRAQCLGEYKGYWDLINGGVCHPKTSNCFAWAEFYTGGFAYYGGFLLATPVAYRLLKSDRFPFWKAADMAGMVVPLGLGFGRLGCLLAGCCFGSPASVPWALRFPPGSPASEAHSKAQLIGSVGDISLPVHPTQIYESLGSFALAALMILWLHGRKRFDGQVFVAFVAGYAALRFLLEFMRDDERGGLLGLSTSQLIGVGLLVGAYRLHQWLAHKSPSVTAPPAAPPAASPA
ncbi:MAG: prolipoprotein diacylglyceryl transferase [Polyangiaceae bacterium]